MIPYPNEPFRSIRNDEHLENLFDYAFELYRYKTRGSSKGDVFIGLFEGSEREEELKAKGVI